MKILVEVDTEKKTCRMIETTNFTVDGICKEVCSYFGIPIDDLTRRPLIKEGNYTRCRKFISIFLVELLGCKHDYIESVLNYAKTDSNSGIISHNIHDLRKNMNKESILEKSKGILGEYTRSYNNLSRLIIQSTIIKSE